MSSVKPVVPTLSHIYARPRQSQSNPSSTSPSGGRSVPHLHISSYSQPQASAHPHHQSHSNDTMSYRSSTSAHHQKPWPLAPSMAVPSPLSASGSSSYYHQHPSARPPTRNVSEIIPRLYISDLSFVENPSMLSSYRITHVLSATSDTVVRPSPSQLPAQPVRLHVRVEDLPFAELAAHLPTTTSFIRNALNSSPDARIVVHCAEGISRSVSVVAAYLMAAYGWAPMEAVAYIKGKRPVANPNFGFVQQLHEYARNDLGRSIPNPTPPNYPPAS